MLDDRSKADAVSHLFEGHATLEQLREAFFIEHDFEGQRFTSFCAVEVEADRSILVNGSFVSQDAPPEQAGTFSRRFFRQNGLLRVYHSSIAVAEAHRHKYIATAHYTKLIRFYHEHGVLNITMDANQDGPTVWPGFGLQLEKERDIQRLLELVRIELQRYRVKEEDLPEPLEALATYSPLLAAIQVAVPAGVRVRLDPWLAEYWERAGDSGLPKRVPVGLMAMRRLYQERGEELRMTIWLDRPKPLDFLIGRGILSPGDSIEK